MKSTITNDGYFRQVTNVMIIIKANIRQKFIWTSIKDNGLICYISENFYRLIKTS